MATLKHLVQRYDIPTKSIPMHEYRWRVHDVAELLETMSYLTNILNGEIMMIGGLSIDPSLLGYRRLRKPSNDLDCVITQAAVEPLVKMYGSDLYFTSEFGDLFLDIAKIPISFEMDNIHGWPISKNFWDEKVTFNLEYGDINVISPEYLIMLKLRRSKFKGRTFGKDVLDIANLLISPQFKDVREVDYTRLSKAVFDNVTRDYSYALSLFEPMRNADRNLNEEETTVLNKELDKLYDCMWAFYYCR